MQWETAYKRADQLNITIVGGTANQVGTSGGWLMVRGQVFFASEAYILTLDQGGGHSLLTPMWGLGVDNLLEMDIVTPDGELQTISECSNPSLFWAVSVPGPLVPRQYNSLTCPPLQVRGGGGGTWGVATSATYKAHPVIQPSVFTAFGVNLTLGRSELETIVSKLANLAPDLADLRIGGSISIDSSTIAILSILPQGGIQTLKTGRAPVMVLFCTVMIKPFSFVAVLPLIEALNSTAGTAGTIIMAFDQYPVCAHFKNSAYICTNMMNEHQDLLGCVCQKRSFCCWWILVFAFLALDSTPLFRK